LGYCSADHQDTRDYAVSRAAWTCFYAVTGRTLLELAEKIGIEAAGREAK